jgi:hypothetical protein
MAARKRLSESEVEFLSRERPYVLFMMQTQMFYDIASMMEDAVERLISIEGLLAKPKGYVQPIKLIVDKLAVLDFMGGPPYTPLFAVSLFNDGPDEVYPGVNEHQKRTALKPGEPLSLEFHAPKIERLYLDVETGKTANIRGYGLY